MTEILVILCIALAVDFLLWCARPQKRAIGFCRDFETGELVAEFYASDIDDALAKYPYRVNDSLPDGSVVENWRIERDEDNPTLWHARYECLVTPETPGGNATSENVRKAQEAVRKVRMSCFPPADSELQACINQAVEEVEADCKRSLLVTPSVVLVSGERLTEKDREEIREAYRSRNAFNLAMLERGCMTMNEVRKLNNLPPLADAESRGIHA